MTRVHRLQLREAELKAAMGAELDKAEGEREEGRIEGLTREIRSLQHDLAAALMIEEEAAIPDKVETPEDHELAELRSRVDFGEYLRAALAGRGVIAGAELEYNQHLGLAEDFFPMDIMARDMETRAARDGDSRTNQGTWIDRVFERTAASRLGVTMRSVNPGVVSIPQTTAGGAPVQRGRTEAVSESTYTVAITEIKPSRSAVHGIYSIEDNLRLPGLADAIMRDMRAAMTEGIDRKIFVGDSGANENGADITGLQTASIGESEINQTNKVKPAETLAMFTSLIDGVYASMLSDLRIVTSVGYYRLLEATIANSAAENQTLAAFLRAAGLSWTSRGGIETATAAGDFLGFAGLSNGIAGAAVAAVWNQGQLIRDPYSAATKGEVQLTLNYFWQFAIPRTANFKRFKAVAD